MPFSRGSFFRFHFCFWLCNHHKSHVFWNSWSVDQMIIMSLAGWSFQTFPYPKNGSRPLKDAKDFFFDGTGSVAPMRSQQQRCRKGVATALSCWQLSAGRVGRWVYPTPWIITLRLRTWKPSWAKKQATCLEGALPNDKVNRVGTSGTRYCS